MKFSSLCLACACLISTHTFAQHDDSNHNEIEQATDTENITAIELLQSLRDIQPDGFIQVPQIQRLHTEKGVTTLFVERHDLPMVDLQLTFNAGSARDTEIAAGLHGLANMTAKLMNKGTSKYTATDIAQRFEDLGAQFSVQAHRDMFIIRLRALSDAHKFKAAVELMLHVFNDAQFNTTEIQRSNQSVQMGQKQLQEKASNLMSIRFQRAIYAQHPYAEPITGTVASNQKITCDDLNAFRKQFLVTENLNLALTGDLNTKKATEIANFISKRIAEGTKAKALPSHQLQDGFKLYHIVSNSSQANVLMGHLGTARDDPDRLALELANRMLGGGGFNSILMQELRMKRGYTYAANSNMSFSSAPGSFSLSYGTRQDQLIDSLNVAHQALIRFATQPLDQAQLEATKSGMLLAFPNLFNSNANINSLLGSMGYYEVSNDYIENYQRNLKAITPEQVQAAVRRYLHPDKLTVVVASSTLDQQQVLQQLQHNLSAVKP